MENDKSCHKKEQCCAVGAISKLVCMSSVAFMKETKYVTWDDPSLIIANPTPITMPHGCHGLTGDACLCSEFTKLADFKVD